MGILEVGCDDGHRQLKIHSITIGYYERAFDRDETCDTACGPFLQSVCQEGTSNHTATACSCKTLRKTKVNTLTLEESQRCDAQAKMKYVTQRTTNPITVAYTK